MNRKLSLMLMLATLFAVSSLAWEHEGFYSAGVGESKEHDFGEGGRVDKLFLKLENHSNVAFQIQVIEAMGVIICLPTIDGKATFMSDSGNKEPLAYMDSNGFMLVKANVAKAMFSEKAKDMDANDQLLIETDYEGAMTYTVLALVGDEYHIKYRW